MSLYERAYPKDLRTKEDRLIRARRGEADLDSESKGRVGFGLSGGGIRSATFCLGAFQGLARHGGLLRKIDILSTVSGGGYFGSFFGRLLGRKYVTNQDDAEAVLKGEKQPEVLKYLRENGRYLSPNGAGDSLLGGAVVLRNWVSIHLVLLVFLLAVFLALQVVRVSLDGTSWFFNNFEGWTIGDSIWGSPFLILPLLTFLLGVYPIGWAYWLVESEGQTIARAGEESEEPENQDRKKRKELARRWKRSSIPPWTGLTLTLVVSLWLTLASVPHFLAWLWGLITAAVIATIVWWQFAVHRKFPEDLESAAQGDSRAQAEDTRHMTIRGILYRDEGIRNRLGLWVTWALVVTAGLLAIALIDSLGQTLYVVLRNHIGVGVWLAGVLSAWPVLASSAKRIVVYFSKGPDSKRPALPLQLIATFAAVALAVVLLVSLDAASHAIAWKLKAPPGVPKSLASEKGKEEKALTVEVRGDGGPVLPMNLKLKAGTEQISESAAAKPAPGVKKPDGAPPHPDPGPAILGLAIAFLLSILFGQTWTFVNGSSHQSLYSSRLTRAYLGASNPNRFGDGSVTTVLPGDNIDLASYWPPPAEKGTPLHLINVTINETIDGRSQVQQQDRKGIGMALGPRGLSVGVEHHLVLPFGDDRKTEPAGTPVDIYPKEGFQVFEYPRLENGQGKPVFTGEMLPLGSWVGISGAAFSTGTGARTSLGLSLLAGMGNVRLGRWWDSGVVRSRSAQDKAGTGSGGNPPQRSRRKLGLRIEDFLARLFPVQVYLLDEFLARFPGTARRHWYLSDGGHFENLGGYELVRRRLEMIVIVDAEQDTEYAFEGLSNLIRKARLDFGAEIEFLTAAELDDEVDESVRSHLGTLDQLRRGTWKDGTLAEADVTGFSLVHAALARITYSSSAPGEPLVSRLLYIKPTLTGDEPADILEYHKAHPAFPHEPTSDQFFDEAQWESYRRLGEHIAEKLFAPAEPSSGKTQKWLSRLKTRKWRPSLLADDVAI
jgi:hypothetical protein